MKINVPTKALQVRRRLSHGWRWLLQKPCDSDSHDSLLTVEHYHELGRTLLQRIPWPNDGQPAVKSIGVTSCYRGEGVSTIARLIAAVAAKSDAHEVLLIDAGADRAKAREPFSYPLALEPTEASPNASDDPFTLDSTPLPNLHVLAVDDREAASRFQSFDSLKAILSDCRERFDLVVVDLPALCDSQWSGSLFSLLDGLVFVVEDGRVRREAARETLDNLKRSGGNLLGVVLNKRSKQIPNWLYRRL